MPWLLNSPPAPIIRVHQTVCMPLVPPFSLPLAPSAMYGVPSSMYGLYSSMYGLYSSMYGVYSS